MKFFMSVNDAIVNIFRTYGKKEVIHLRDKPETADIPGAGICWCSMAHRRLVDGKYVFNMKRRQKC